MCGGKGKQRAKKGEKVDEKQEMQNKKDDNIDYNTDIHVS